MLEDNLSTIVDIDDDELLSEIESIRSGKYFPTSDPYTEKQDIARLQIGVERGLYEQSQLDAILKDMRASDAYKKLRKINKIRWELDHTPFGERDGLDDYGFHVFIGREEFADGDKNFVTLDVTGSISYLTLEQALDDLVSAVKKGRRVLLSKSPGMWECPKSRPYLASRTYLPFHVLQMIELQQKFEYNPEMAEFENPFKYQPE